jgi:hypothetical protein
MSVPISEISREPRHPDLFEKKKSIGVPRERGGPDGYPAFSPANEATRLSMSALTTMRR